ncbi:hypothetical protein KVT40_004490 [Elsinoe batatas]|uniref:Uncharacterized protein n=1 Tax=Elsinoe batatas TaxID=2601811 RepID=A0A8K0L0U2_9PEZI|nr:hypothetical protein KVT40_004490 [Elsinoe batatas]
MTDPFKKPATNLLRPSKHLPLSSSSSSTQSTSSAGDLQIAISSASSTATNVTFDSSVTPLYFLDDEALKRRKTHFKRT